MSNRENKPGDTRLHARVHGRVQGVSYRYYTRRRATELHLTGYVRNLADRNVEVVAEGDRSTLDELLDFLRVGPPAAMVLQVDPRWLRSTGEFSHFEVRY